MVVWRGSTRNKRWHAKSKPVARPNGAVTPIGKTFTISPYFCEYTGLLTPPTHLGAAFPQPFASFSASRHFVIIWRSRQSFRDDTLGALVLPPKWLRPPSALSAHCTFCGLDPSVSKMFVEPRPDRGTVCLDDGAYIVNFKKCGRSTYPTPHHPLHPHPPTPLNPSTYSEMWCA